MRSSKISAKLAALCMPVRLHFPIARGVCLLAFIALSAACGSDPKPPPPPPPPSTAAAPAESAAPPPSAEAEIGGLNEEAMNRAFSSLEEAVQECIASGITRVKTLGGSATIKLRIKRDGTPRWAYMKTTSLGDRETEKCLLAAVRAKTWPEPLGGEGIAEKSFELEAQSPPIALDEKRSKLTLAQIRKDHWKCRKSVRGTFTATVYVRTNGHVISAGITPPSEKGEDAADCMAEMIKKMKFVPGRKTGKLSFTM